MGQRIGYRLLAGAPGCGSAAAGQPVMLRAELMNPVREYLPRR